MEMKKIIIGSTILAIICLAISSAISQNLSGRVVVDYLYAESLENSGGENPTRRVTVYLPPGYEESQQRYPVIYYLHGFTSSDSVMIAIRKLDTLLDYAISNNIIKPVMVVIPNQHTLYRGSFYTNSSLTGKWADFTGVDLIAYTDKNYRTIPNKGSRGIAGHSMGGHGALKIGMLFPDVFSSVYALSPAVLDIVGELGYHSEAYKRLPNIKSRKQLVNGWVNFYPNAIIAMGRAYTPNPNNPPFYADVPYNMNNGTLTVNYEVLKIWQEESVMGMVDDHIDDLKKLKAIKLDWGRNEENTHIPKTAYAFSLMLENLGITHYAEEYIGKHVDKLWTKDGRALNDLLPFFNTYLNFDE